MGSEQLARRPAAFKLQCVATAIFSIVEIINAKLCETDTTGGNANAVLLSKICQNFYVFLYGLLFGIVYQGYYSVGENSEKQYISV